jgi:hypothetical protein
MATSGLLLIPGMDGLGRLATVHGKMSDRSRVHLGRPGHKARLGQLGYKACRARLGRLEPKDRLAIPGQLAQRVLLVRKGHRDYKAIRAQPVRKAHKVLPGQPELVAQPGRGTLGAVPGT